VAFLAMASFLLVTLIVESAQIYANALGAAASAEQRLAQLEHARRPLEVINVKAAREEPVESFVLRQNIARYRTMLESRTLDEAQRRTIERLLSEEQGKYRAMDSPKNESA
jgi:hypothetical protein